MLYRKTNEFTSNTIAKTILLPHENPVRAGLAYTPSELSSMVENGIPISSQNTALLPEQGMENPTFDIPLERQRGTNIVELWNAQLEARHNVNSYYNKKRKERLTNPNPSEQTTIATE